MSDDIDVLKPDTIAKPKIEQPRLYKVVLLNDDYTPREFVVQVLKAVFRTTEDQAYRIMMTAHQRGVCVVATFTRDIAESKAKEGTDMGRQKGYPLISRPSRKNKVAAALVGAELLDAPAAFAQARHVGGVGDAEVGAHAVGRALHGGDVLLLQQRRHEIGVGGDLAAGLAWSCRCSPRCWGRRRTRLRACGR